MNPLQKLAAYGQSPWLDYLTRSLMEKGELAEMINRDGYVKPLDLQKGHRRKR
jgi:transaldolase/glucose-6-phosphate isomerase